MSEAVFAIVLIALVLDWYLGEPQVLWSRVPHPVVVFGNAIGWVDARFNRSEFSDSDRYRSGALAISGLILLALFAGLALTYVCDWLGFAGLGVECIIVFVFLAQRSLYDHVAAVADSLSKEGLAGGQKAVGMIVGRDPKLLDEAGVCRASIETLAENFSDGVVAPAFWYVVFGLPGLLVYKMINTADSMIGYKNSKYLYFGRAAARIDDLANWLPARLSAVIIALGGLTMGGLRSAQASLVVALTESGLHRSPNAGWPEAAMAGATGLALGGPRVYPSETVPQSFINGNGKRQLTGADIRLALGYFSAACYVLWGIAGLGAILFMV